LWNKMGSEPEEWWFYFFFSIFFGPSMLVCFQFAVIFLFLIAHLIFSLESLLCQVCSFLSSSLSLQWIFFISHYAKKHITHNT
jgi:hypothetical protein